MAESINPAKLHHELKAAGLPVVGVSSSGRIDYDRSLTAAEKESALLVMEAHDPSPSDAQVFIEQLAKAGVSKNEVIYALWKSVTDGDNQNTKEILQNFNK